MIYAILTSECEPYRMNDDSIRFKEEVDVANIVGGQDTLDKEYRHIVSFRDKNKIFV